MGYFIYLMLSLGVSLALAVKLALTDIEKQHRPLTKDEWKEMW